VAGVLAVASVPIGIAVARYTRLTLLESTVSIALAALLGAYAILLARRGRERVQITLGRAGGETAARIGRLLGFVGIWGAGSAALAVGFYGLLSLFAS
jgi:hypothetical protein